MKTTTMKKMLLVLTFSLATGALACVASAADQKEIRVEEAEASGAKLKVDFKAAKNSFGVDEPITFQVRSNKQVYLYLFNVNDEEKAVQIYPNKYDKANLLKPNRTVNLPSKKSTFRSDAPGVERLILVASEKKLNLQHDEAEGIFWSVDRGDVDKVVKAIRVEEAEKPAAPKRSVVKELDVIIKSN